MPGPRTPQTLKLEPTRRQFFQWYFVERMTITEVKERMDELSKYLNRPAGEDFIASVSEWAGRRRYWNSQRATRWNIEDKARGNLNLAIPADIAHLSLWWKGSEDVGNWRTIPQYDDHRIYLPSASGSTRGIRHENTIDQTSDNGHWEDAFDWGPIRENDSVDAPRKPSVSSASSNNSYASMSKYAISNTYSATTTEDDNLPKPYYDPNTDMNPPQVFHYEDNTEFQGLDGQSISSQQAMDASAMPRTYSGPGYTPPQNSTPYLSESAVPYVGLQGNHPPVPMTLSQQDQPAQSYQLQYQDIYPADFPNSYWYLGPNPALSPATPLLEHQLQRSQSYRK